MMETIEHMTARSGDFGTNKSNVSNRITGLAEQVSPRHRQMAPGNLSERAIVSFLRGVLHCSVKLGTKRGEGPCAREPE